MGSAKEESTKAQKLAKDSELKFKAENDKLVEVSAEFTEKEDLAREKRNKMAKRAEDELGKNNHILENIREKKQKDEEYKTAELNKKTEKKAKKAEEETYKEGKR